jgi:hypothetical protein
VLVEELHHIRLADNMSNAAARKSNKDTHRPTPTNSRSEGDRRRAAFPPQSRGHWTALMTPQPPHPPHPPQSGAAKELTAGNMSDWRPRHEAQPPGGISGWAVDQCWTSARPWVEGHTRSGKVNCARKDLQESGTSGTDLMPLSPLCSSTSSSSSSSSSSLVSLSSASNTPTRWTTCTGTPPGVSRQGHHQAGLGAITISSTGHFAPGQSSLTNSQPTDAKVS